MRILPRRVVVVGSVLVDVLLRVERLPPRDGDVLARGRIVTSGGGFNVLAGATRLGLPSAYAGHVGSGPFGAQVAGDLRAAGIPVLLPRAKGDTGFDIGLVEDGGHTTYVTAPGVESKLTPADLASLSLKAEDAIYVSGYDLCYEVSGAALGGWLPHLSDEFLVVVDPGPLVSEIPAERLAPVLARTDILSLNEREAGELTGHDEPPAAAEALTERVSGRGRVVLRAGEAGCWVASRYTPATHIPGRPARFVDATGAGDAHVSALLARLALGHDFRTAAFEANIAASLSVERSGPAGGPTAGELAQALANSQR